MRVATARGHGKIALRLTRLPAAGGSDVTGLIRNPAHGTGVRGAEAWATSAVRGRVEETRTCE